MFARVHFHLQDTQEKKRLKAENCTQLNLAMQAHSPNIYQLNQRTSG